MLALLFAAAAATPRVATLDIPGPPRFVRVARDVVDVAFGLDPSLAAQAGLFDDALRVPSFAPDAVEEQVERLDRDLARLRAMPWRDWDVDTQIDFRLVYAAAEAARHQLLTDRLYVHRPAQWLEPVANDLMLLASYAPDRPELQDRVLAQIPAMVAEMRAVATGTTRRDADTARGIAAAVAESARLRGATEAAEALTAYAAELAALDPAADFAVIGAESYAWRYRRALMLPWTPEELLAKAEADLADIDARIAALPPRATAPEPTEAQLARARALSREGLFALYDEVSVANREATLRGGWVTIPDAVGPVRARETPDAMVPLTGDGGSMNPPPTFGASNVGYWNVEHFREDWPEARRLESVVSSERYLLTGMGPYAAHEGYPGHHLQLSIARLHPDPLRSILPDPVQNEGWGLYSEEVFLDHGGLGDSADAERNVLGSYRHRIRRVVYDVHIETGAWTLQEAADYKHGVSPAPIDEELMRSINWPAQLVCYYAGKSQILELREAWRARTGADERAFHDAFLAEGSIPIALIRAKMLGEPVPGIE